MTPSWSRIVSAIVALLAAVLWWTGSSESPVPPMPIPAPALPQAGASAETPAIGFRNQERLQEHFEKHGREFGASSAEQYDRMARALRDAPISPDILEATRKSDGVISRFDRTTGAFIAFETNGTIRTFFKPNDGERYFRRQLTRRPND